MVRISRTLITIYFFLFGTNGIFLVKLFRLKTVNCSFHFSLRGWSVLLRFSQTCEFWSSKANWRLRFSLLSIILTDLLGNKTLLHGFKRSWFSIRFVCFSVSRFVACDRNYDWRQRKTQLWRRLLNFRVCMFVKSAVMLRSSKGSMPAEERSRLSNSFSFQLA